MDLEEVKAFLEKHPNLKEERPGLYDFLADIYWCKLYKVGLEESEHLVGIEITELANGDPRAWSRELERYRGQRK